MAKEGWGGTAPKVHYIRDGRAICGRTSPGFEPTLNDTCYSESDRARHPEQYCKLCGRIVDAEARS